MNTAESPAPAIRLRDYLELCKPKVVALMLLTVLVGMLLATSSVPPWPTMLSCLLGVGFCAAAAAVINHFIDADRDAQMARTRGRPLPQGRVSRRMAALWAAVLCALGSAILIVGTNLLTLVLTLAAVVGYAFVYTLWLKYKTPQNIVIGGISGAAPPLLGWTAVTGYIEPQPLLLVGLIFVWTPAHFWALALHRPEDYQKVDIPMLPVVHGEDLTRLHILLYATLTLVISLLPFGVGYHGFPYLIGAFLLGLAFVFASWRLYMKPSRSAALNVFHFSNWYLMLMFALMIFDHYWYASAATALPPHLVLESV